MTRFLLSVLLASCILFSSLPAYAEPVDDQATTVEHDQAVPMQGVADSSVRDETEDVPVSSVEGGVDKPQHEEVEEDSDVSSDSPQVLSISQASPAERLNGWSRIWGDTKLDTMAAISQKGWSTCDVVVIATIKGYWDALAASSLAGALNCPILLTSSTELSPQTAQEIKRLGAKRAYLCGGPRAISASVDSQIKSIGCGDVRRVYGEHQQQTSVAIAELVMQLKPSSSFIVATSKSFHDALSIAPYAYAYSVPVLICNDGSNILPSESERFIKRSPFDSALVLGGHLAVATSVDDSLKNWGVETVTRVQGDTKYETGVELAKWQLSHGMNLDTPALATGETYYDALAGAALCGKNRSVLVIANNDNRIAITDFISQHRGKISGGYVFGGEIAVSSSVYHTLEYCWKNGYSNDYATDEEAPYKAVYNYEYYRANNPDVKQAFGNNRQATLDHFLNSGMRERRRGCEGFDVRSYYNQYEDLRRAFAVNWPAYYRHFMEHGQREGRVGTGCGAVSGWQYHNVPWHGQPNNFYCGPTSGQMILEAAGKWGSANGTPLNMWNVAKYMHTDAYHFTSFNDRWFERGMNDWLGYRAYTTLHTPSYGAARDAVMRSYDRGLAAAVDAQERRGGPHFNGHNNGTFSHIMVVDGYNNASDHVIIADPGAKVLWGGASRKFEYPSFNNFITTYCQHEIMGDGKQHIGMYVPV